ncbi:MAG: tRNA lysidine(34) synthetase TilS [Fidelibacterota bacterium]
MNLYNKFKEFIFKKSLIENHNRILAAVSGGVDSTVMLHMLNRLCDEMQIELGIIHLNHSLRGSESDRDQQFVEELAKKFKIPCYSRKVDVRNYARLNRTSMHQAAREIRYKYFLNTAREHNWNRVATAHNADDQVETVIMRFLRGTGISGFEGILLSEGMLIRPLLFARRSEIESHAVENGISFVMDSSNLNRKYLRNRIRLELIPLLKERYNPGLTKTIEKNSKILREFKELLEFHGNNAIERSILSRDAEKIILDIRTLKDYFITIRKYVFQKLFESFAGAGKGLSYGQLERIEKLLVNERVGSQAALGSNVKIGVDRGKVIIYRDLSRPFNYTIEPGNKYDFNEFSFISEILSVDRIDKVINPDPCIEVVDYKFVRGKALKLRSWREGDRINPLGMKGLKKVSDVFIDKKIPVYRKQTIPILECSGEILWICGVQPSNIGRISSETKEVLKMIYKERHVSP